MSSVKKRDFQFSGHETFTLRQNWIYKVVTFCNEALKNNKQVHFNDSHTVVSLGVGKNMVSSMKWWGYQTGFLENIGNKTVPTELANLIFGSPFSDKEPLDPFGETLTTAWIAHWNLCSQANRLTALWYLFNIYNDQTVTREILQKRVEAFAEENNIRVAGTSIRRDVEVIFRAYCFGGKNRKENFEDKVDSFFGSLGLIALRDDSTANFEICRTKRPTLPTPLFVWAVLDHWLRLNEVSPSKTLDWYEISFAANSPGRVFKLSESDLNERLEQFEQLTAGKVIWTDQLGIKNLICSTASVDFDKLKKDMLIRAFKG